MLREEGVEGFARDDEAMLELEAALDCCAVDLGVETEALAQGRQLVGRTARMPAAASADIPRHICRHREGPTRQFPQSC